MYRHKYTFMCSILLDTYIDILILHVHVPHCICKPTFLSINIRIHTNTFLLTVGVHKELLPSVHLVYPRVS